MESESRAAPNEGKMMRLFARRPLISVIMASYNHADFVRDAVCSVLDQTCDDLELIVVDDGSTDGTPDIIRQIRDPRLRLYAMEHNRAVHGRNYALRDAKARFVAFQNSDDTWAPDKLARQLALIEGQSGVEAVFTGVSFVDERGEQSDGDWAAGLFQFKEQSQSAWLRRFFNNGNCLALPSAMVRRRTLNAIGGFRETLVQLSDFDLWIRLAAIGSFVQDPEPLTRLRIRASNLSAPSQRTHRRTVIELARVFGRFAEPALLALYPQIFPDLTRHRTTVLRQAELAQHAASKSGSHYIHFADQLFEHLFDNSNHRAEITRAMGAEVFAEFLERRRYLALEWVDDKS